MDDQEPICPVCHIGKLQTQRITYTQVFEGKFIVIPNVAAQVCDVCGEKVFDRETLSRLSGLLNQSRRDTPHVTHEQSWP